MLAIKGIYDGKTIRPLEKIKERRKYKVVITFIEALDDAEELRGFSAQTASFHFWNDTREDIYQDYLAHKK